MNPITHESEHELPDQIRAWYSRLGAKGGHSRSPRKLAAARSNLAAIKLTPEQRRANALKGAPDKTLYRERAIRAWARRKEQAK